MGLDQDHSTQDNLAGEAIGNYIGRELEIVASIESGLDDIKAGRIPLQGELMDMSNFNHLSINVPEMNYILTPMAMVLLVACEEKRKDETN